RHAVSSTTRKSAKRELMIMHRCRSSLVSARVALLALAALFAASAAPVSAQSRVVLPDFTELYEKQSPAVVSIDVTQKVKQARFPELSEDDPFYEFFRRFGQVP